MCETEYASPSPSFRISSFSHPPSSNPSSSSFILTKPPIPPFLENKISGSFSSSSSFVCFLPHSSIFKSSLNISSYNLFSSFKRSSNEFQNYYLLKQSFSSPGNSLSNTSRYDVTDRILSCSCVSDY